MSYLFARLAKHFLWKNVFYVIKGEYNLGKSIIYYFFVA